MKDFSKILQFRSADQSDDLRWADFLFNVGAKLASLEEQSKKSTLLLILPVIEVAAPLITLGYIRTKLNKKRGEILDINFFRSLPVGTPLILRSTDSSQHAVFDGIAKHTDKTCNPTKEVECVIVRFQKTSKGRDSKLLLAHQLHNLTVVSSEQTISERDLGKDADGISKFSRSILGPTNNMSEIVDSVWIVGKTAELEEEFLNIPLFSKNRTGTFNDLLRAAQFVNAREHAFTNLVPCFTSNLDYQQSTQAAKLTIFRESASYLKHQHNYAHGSKIAVLDFSDRNINDVIESYNQKYYSRSADLNLEIENSVNNAVCVGFLEAI